MFDRRPRRDSLPVRPSLLLAHVLVALVLAACERPFIEPREPDLVVVNPDLSQVLPGRDILLQVEATSQNGVDSVLLNGIPLLPESQPGRFSRPLKLNHGLSRLVLEAFDQSGAQSRDTVYAAVVASEASVGDAQLPEARGGHTAVRLADGRLLVAGGSELPTVPASNAAWLYDGFDLRAAPSELFMIHRRTEHTATLLPDGRVLFLGGSELTQVPTINELVEPVELFDPDSVRFVEIPVSGDPIRRSGHTAILFQVGRQGATEAFIYLYGGTGDIQYRPQPRLGIRSDIRVFQFRNDSLIALGPTIGPFIDAVTDHVTVPVQPQIGNRGEYLVGGSIYVADEVFDDVVFHAELSTTSGIRLISTDPITLHRSGHAAGRVVGGEIFLFGGRSFVLTSAIRNNEVYYSQIRRFFPMDVAQGLLQKRWGHTATNWDANRILILGGYGETGAALRSSEWFTVDRSD